MADNPDAEWVWGQEIDATFGEELPDGELERLQIEYKKAKEAFEQGYFTPEDFYYD